MMNRMIVMVAILFISVNRLVAQIEQLEKRDWTVVGELKSLGVTKARMQFLPHGSDTTYMLFMKDMKNPKVVNYFSVSFRNINNTYGQLFDLMKTFFTEENRRNKKYEQTFRLGTTYVHIQHKPLITSHGIMLTTKEGFIYLSERDIEKLFGK